MGIHLMSQTCLPGEWKGETLFGFRLNSWGRGCRRGTGLGSSRARGPERLGSGKPVAQDASVLPSGAHGCNCRSSGLPAGKNGAEGRLIAHTQSWCLRTPLPTESTSDAIHTDGSPEEAEGPTCPV